MEDGGAGSTRDMWTTPALAPSVLCNYFGTLGTSESLKLPGKDVAAELWLIWVDFSSAWLQLSVLVLPALWQARQPHGFWEQVAHNLQDPGRALRTPPLDVRDLGSDHRLLL